MIWIIFSALSLLSIIFILWPLINSQNHKDNEKSFEIEFFKKQLSDLNKDIELDILSKKEADEISIEINRRLLKAQNARKEFNITNNPKLLILTSMVIAVGMPFTTLIIYMNLGFPNYNVAINQNTSTPLTGHPDDNNVDNLILTLSERLDKNPNDIEGWLLLARTYREINNIPKALKTYKDAMLYNPNNIPIASEYAEVIVISNQGEVNEVSELAFKNILLQDRKNPRARFYIGLALSQRGEPQKAIAVWRDLTKDAPPSAPWLSIVKDEMAKVAIESNIMPMSINPQHPLEGQLSENQNINTENNKNIPLADEENFLPDVSNLSNNFSSENLKMIQEMVGGLEARLEFGEEDYEGWLQLGRSYIVLENYDKAKFAFENASRMKPYDVFPLIQIANILLKPIPNNSEIPPQLGPLSNKILKIDQDNPDGLFIAGLLAEKNGDKALAKKYWLKLIQVLPDDDSAINSIKRRLAEIK